MTVFTVKVTFSVNTKSAIILCRAVALIFGRPMQFYFNLITVILKLTALNGY